MKKPTKVITRTEVLQQLAEKLRNPKLDDKTFVKLVTFYGALAGWEGF